VVVEADRIGSVILWGPPGTGKTTLARLLATVTSKAFVPLSAVASGVKDVREALEGARRRLGERGQGTILFVDEVHRFNKAQQDVLLPGVEEGLVVLVGATTENPFFEVNAPLMSRATLWRLHPLSDEDLRALVVRGLAAEEARAQADAVDALVATADGDARALLTTLELSVVLAADRARLGSAARVGAPGREMTDSRGGAGVPASGGARVGAPGREMTDSRGGAGVPASGGARVGAPGREIPTVTLEDVARARDGRLYHQGVDDHYDQVSAFIKSVRGSDPDAGLYWLARMLAAGEDARFIARRLVILASEDVGMADPLALVVADAAARAVEMVGLPEASLNLAQAVLHLACAPKSNRLTVALSRAQEDVRSGGRAGVPEHLRDAHYRGAAGIGHGVGYRYPHDEPGGWVSQQYRPVETEGHIYYEPSDRGAEHGLASRIHRPSRPQQ